MAPKAFEGDGEEVVWNEDSPLSDLLGFDLGAEEGQDRSGLKALILPSVTLALFQLTLVMRLVRAEMLEVLRTLKTRLVIPMHYFGPTTLNRFIATLQGSYELEIATEPVRILSSADLPPQLAGEARQMDPRGAAR